MAIQASSDNAPPVPRRIALIADDDANMRDVLRSLLTEAGYTVVAVATGREALTVAPYLRASVAILDLAMPDGNGAQTCSALRRIPEWESVPILILSNYHTDEALRTVSDAGASGFMNKPLVPLDLLQRIAALVGGGQPVQQQSPALPRESDLPLGGSAAAAEIAIDPSVAPSSHDDGATEPPGRILVAEDDPIIREVFTHILTRENYLVDVAADGQEAVSAVTAGNYDLVVMDARMPILNGLDATRLIRNLPDGKGNTPIIMMTATAFKDDRREMQDAGITAYLPKGVKPQELVDCVRLHLRGEAHSAQPDRPAGHLPVLDLMRVAAEQKLFAPSAMPRFLYTLEVTIEEFLPGIDGRVVKDAVVLRSELHKIAGIAGTLGCTALSEIAKTLEAAPVIPGPACERFVETAHATVAAIRRFRKGHG